MTQRIHYDAVNSRIKCLDTLGHEKSFVCVVVHIVLLPTPVTCYCRVHPHALRVVCPGCIHCFYWCCLHCTPAPTPAHAHTNIHTHTPFTPMLTSFFARGQKREPPTSISIFYLLQSFLATLFFSFNLSLSRVSDESATTAPSVARVDSNSTCDSAMNKLCVPIYKIPSLLQ